MMPHSWASLFRSLTSRRHSSSTLPCPCANADDQDLSPTTQQKPANTKETPTPAFDFPRFDAGVAPLDSRAVEHDQSPVMHASFKALGWGGSGALRFMASRSASASAAATRTAAAAVGGVAVARKWGPFKLGGVAAAMPAQNEATAGHVRGAKGFSSASTTGFQRNFHVGAVLRTNFPIR